MLSCLCSERSCNIATISSRQMLLEVPCQSTASVPKRLRHSNVRKFGQNSQSGVVQSSTLLLGQKRKFERHFATATSSSFWRCGRTAVPTSLATNSISCTSNTFSRTPVFRQQPVNLLNAHGALGCLCPLPAPSLKTSLGLGHQLLRCCVMRTPALGA